MRETGAILVPTRTIGQKMLDSAWCHRLRRASWRRSLTGMRRLWPWITSGE